MLKFFFWTLLLANLALFAYQRGYFEVWLPSGHEPARLSNQLNADKIKIVPAPAAKKPAPVVANASAETPVSAPADAPAVPVAAAVPAPAPVEKKAPVIACTEIGNFSVEDAKRFSAQLAALSLGERVKQRSVKEVTSHIVYIPPQADKESADKKVAELRALGIRDFFLIRDNSNLRWAISLGVFKQEEAARAHLANLVLQGVQGARLGERGVVRMVAFQVRELDADKKASLEKIKAKFPKQEMRACEAA